MDDEVRRSSAGIEIAVAVVAWLSMAMSSDDCELEELTFAVVV